MTYLSLCFALSAVRHVPLLVILDRHHLGYFFRDRLLLSRKDHFTGIDEVCEREVIPDVFVALHVNLLLINALAKRRNVPISLIQAVKSALSFNNHT
jgi:hypothetical protein